MLRFASVKVELSIVRTNNFETEENINKTVFSLSILGTKKNTLNK